MPLAKDDVIKAIRDLRSNSSKRKFKQSVELIVRLRDIDLKKPENRIAESIELPNPLDRQVKVCVIAGGDLALRARASGADLVVDRGELERLGKDKKAARKLSKSYDFFIAEAPLMPLVGRTIGPMLGPRGRMPTPIPPTATIDQIVANHRRMVRVRLREQPVLQCRVGTESMEDEKIAENIQTVFSRLEAKLEKGIRNIGGVMIKATMGPTVKLPLGKAV